VARKGSGLGRGVEALWEQPADEPEASQEKDDAGTPVDQYTSTTVQHPTDTPAHQQDSTPAQQPTSKPKLPKATFYLDRETIERLEKAWMKLRGMAPLETRGQLSKSAIVEAAILAAIEDLEKRGEESSLAGTLVHQHDSTP
jgi:hypothetical protein